MSKQPDARRVRENYKLLGNAVFDLRECILSKIIYYKKKSGRAGFDSKQQTDAG